MFMSEQNRIDELERQVKELKAKIEALKNVTSKLLDMYDSHIQGKWTLEEIKLALENIQELISLLRSSGMLQEGGDNSSMLQRLIAEEYMRSRRVPQQGDVEVERLSKKEMKKLKKIMKDEDEEDEEQEQEDQDQEDEEE
ncbi:hypothetical protein SSRV2_ORF33 [Saccharolobus shibatae rod virus 2]|nr:hypothetical protein [Saccharolobus shibatae filamentous virus 3]WHA35208.1 hypothetical protein SSRV2_ORF33 [Saccharolobus shibatae rod virus 2]